jgi:hypothetical protein
LKRSEEALFGSRPAFRRPAPASCLAGAMPPTIGAIGSSAESFFSFFCIVVSSIIVPSIIVPAA